MNMAPAPELIFPELLRELRKLGDLRAAVEALVTVVSDTRDEIIRTRHVNQDILEVMRDVRDSLRANKRFEREVG